MLMPLRVPSVAVALVLSLCLAAGATGAAEKARKPAASKGPEDRVLSPAQLKECVDQKARLQTQTDAALKAKADLATQKSEIDTTGTALADAVVGLDRTSAEAVNEHNAKVDQRTLLVDAYQAGVTAYNNQAESITASRAAYAKACESRRYDDRDMADLKRKK
jgi:hypothetical protein